MALSRVPEELLQRADLWVGSRSARVDALPTGHAELDAMLPGGGLPRGAVSELLLPAAGCGELALLTPLLARLTAAGKPVALISPPADRIPYAPALARAGVRLAALWVIDAREAADTLWSAEQLLKSPNAGAALAWMDRADERAQRRLQLAAESTGALAILLRPASAERQNSVAALRMRLTPTPQGPQLDLLKVRGGRAGQKVQLA